MNGEITGATIALLSLGALGALCLFFIGYVLAGLRGAQVKLFKKADNNLARIASIEARLAVLEVTVRLRSRSRNYPPS